MPVAVIGAALFTVALGSIGVDPGSAVAQPLLAPDPDPFYAAPADIADHKPGDVLGVRAMPALGSFPDTEIRLIKFRSTDSEGKPIAATTTVLSPRNRRPDAPLLSLQQIINGLGAQCAVSRVLYTTDPNLTVREAPAWNVLLQRGWTVALPDHLGPRFAYGAAKLGGQITLDGIRAAQHVSDLKVERSPVAMAGYSGGGMATAWAAALAATYAPDLRIAGAAMGGVPMNLVSMLETLGLNRHPAFGLALAAGLGLEREYPDRFPLSAQLNEHGMAVRDKLVNSCTNDILAAGAGQGALDIAKTTVMTDDPQARSVVEENSLELFPGVPNMPVFEWHSPIDGLVPVDAIVDTVHRYCAAGARVWSEPEPVPDHLTAAVLGLPAVLAWLDARMRGDAAPTNC
ncbi:Triacylglycerol lipase [Nocardia seriolae]|uniref:Lipase n=1 Tax=Nocardia seriolae TaxID=37332 RepID=A0ABC8B313_9NOCA|nr:Triacylglycerol lipase [Nocardia seriolae]GEM23045.1 putative lipase [Nocardia seriolae NBRC 15557]BAW08936.1 lipase [Nocardia seriolae]BEK86224.1 lipase family protein [Nocardia seriolae]BEK97843.1 lipase family protein [Nocardia seriolae]